MAQRRAKDIEEKEEAGRHKKAPQPVYDQRKQAVEAEDSRVGQVGAVLNLQQTYGNKYVQQLMNKVQAKLTVNPPDDQYEKEADRVTDAVSKAPASSVQRQTGEEEVSRKLASAIQRQAEEEEEKEEEEPIQAKPEDHTRLQRQAEEEEEKEEEEPIQAKIPQIQRQAAATTAKVPEAKAGVDKTRAAALKAMFESAVVRQCRTAYKALKQKEPDAELAFQNVGTAITVIRSIIPPYEGVEPMHSSLIATSNALSILRNQLGPHVGLTSRPLTQIRDHLNPDGETMLKYFQHIRSQF